VSRVRALALLLAGLAFSAAAGPKVEATGYLDGRFSFTRSRTWGLLPTDDQPQVQGLLELNTQVKVSVREHSFGYSDVSLVANRPGAYRGWRDGQDVALPDHPTAAALPVVSLNEVYWSHEFVPALHLLVGKKRITWGAGVAFNPTDLLNPRRDPTDPTFQRAGAWLAQLEVPLENVTFSLMAAPTVLAQGSGIPTQMIRWPSWDKRDSEDHYQLAARAYALVAEADLNLMVFYGNRSVDALPHALRVGVSASRYFFVDQELHVEALFQQGSARAYPRAGCVQSLRQAAGCVSAGGSLFETRALSDEAIVPRVLVGTRRQFPDDSLVSLEYLYQADGWTRGDYQAYADGLTLLKQARDLGLPGVPLAFAPVQQDGLPVRFAFEPRGQHYLFASWQKPRIRDDFTLQLVVVASLLDLSTLVTPSFAWSATEWLTLTAYGFVPLPGPAGLAVTAADGTKVSEFGSAPFAGRGMLEAKLFF
jgi:hypothetical protein